MKLVKYLLVLAVVVCATARPSSAQNVVFLGGGSSALFLELGQAAFGVSAEGCVWTSGSSSKIEASDDRTSPATTETGSYWVVWGKGTGSCAAPAGSFNVYSYLQLDSVLGDRCFFMVNASGVAGCQMILTETAGTAGANLLGTGFTDTGIPASVIAAVNGKRFFVAGTDIRPEDAKFASRRMFTACGTALAREPGYATVGLGYQTAKTGVGTTVLSDFSTKSFHVLDFNISGLDPITAKAVRTFSTSTVGAQPIVVTVSPAGGTGIGAATNINSATLAKFMDGTLGLDTDLQGPTSASAVTTLVREPLSGTYNTTEYSVPNTVGLKTSQDANNCSGTVVHTNPLHLASANGKAGLRRRVIGTGEMVAELQAATSTDQRLGYFFWSSANAAAFTATNGKYLTLNGVDPLANDYSVTNGRFPTVAAGTIGDVTFLNLDEGNYAAWSALRLVSTSPTPPGVTAVIAAAQTLNSTKHDFVTLATLRVWHSHFTIPGIGITTAANGKTLNTVGDLCGTATALAEEGGDAGGVTIQKAANHDYCADFASTTGEVGLNQ